MCEPSHAPLEVSTSAFAAALLSVLPMVSTRSHNVRVGKATHENGAGSERMRWEAWPCLYCQAMTRTTTCCAPIITTADWAMLIDLCHEGPPRFGVWEIRRGDELGDPTAATSHESGAQDARWARMTPPHRACSTRPQ